MEQWRVIPNYPEYEVSDWGRVRTISGEKIPQTMDRDGYMVVNIGDGVWFVKRNHVHRLVLKAFVGEPPEGLVCCHENDIPDDNRLVNLSWGSPKFNGAGRSKNKRNNKKLVKVTRTEFRTAAGKRREALSYSWADGSLGFLEGKF